MNRIRISANLALLILAGALLVSLAAGSAWASTNLAGLWHFDEGVGTSAFDSSGNGNLGTLIGAPPLQTWPSGKFKTAVNLDGVDDYVQVTDSASLEPSVITVELWVNSAAPGTFAYLVSKGSQGCSAPSYSFNTVGGSGGLFFDVWDGTRLVRSPEVPAANIFNGYWHHVAGTLDGTTVRIYLDGAEVGTGRSVPSTFLGIKYDLPTTMALLFGNYDAGGTCSFDFHITACWTKCGSGAVRWAQTKFSPAPRRA